MKKLYVIMSLALVGLASSRLYAKYEQEQLDMENQLQQRIEGILSRTLPPNSYLVTVKVEMDQRERPAARQSATAKRGGNNRFAAGRTNTCCPAFRRKKEFVPPQEADHGNHRSAPSPPKRWSSES